MREILIKKRETLKLLRKVQKFQCSDCGAHKIDIQTYVDDETKKLWFVCNGTMDNEVIMGSCYEWRTYAENEIVINDFISAFNKD